MTTCFRSVALGLALRRLRQCVLGYIQSLNRLTGGHHVTHRGLRFGWRLAASCAELLGNSGALAFALEHEPLGITDEDEEGETRCLADFWTLWGLMNG